MILKNEMGARDQLSDHNHNMDSIYENGRCPREGFGVDAIEFDYSSTHSMHEE